MVATLRFWIIHTFAGTGEAGYSREGGPAVRMSLNEPKGLAVECCGTVLIADSENHVVRKVDRKSGVMSTVAGLADVNHETADAGRDPEMRQPMADDPFADMGQTLQKYAQQTDLSGTVRYVVNGVASRTKFNGDGGPATGARLNFPTAVIMDQAGNLYIADTMNHRIRVVEARSGVITTIAGTGQPRMSGDGGPAIAAGLNEPAALALVEPSTLYIADQSNHRVRAIDLATGFIRTVAGTGSAAYNGDGIPATEAALAGPSGLACADDGTLFIADTFNGRIRAVDPATGLIQTVVGDGREYRYQGDAEPPSSSLSRPSGIALDREGNLFITDSDNHLVRRWNRTTRMLERVAGVGTNGYGGDGGPASNAGLNYPFGIAVDAEGHVFVADTFNHRIREIAPSR